MSKVKVEMLQGETPSQAIINKANQELIITDALGRKITLKKPGVLAQFRLVEALGDSAKNEVYMGMVLPIIYVSSIDGLAVPSPTRKSEVEALIQRLEDEGIRAVVGGVQGFFGNRDAQEDAKDAVKK